MTTSVRRVNSSRVGMPFDEWTVQAVWQKRVQSWPGLIHGSCARMSVGPG